MKKWSSIILSAAVALSIPASAYATGDTGSHVESVLSIDGKIDAKWQEVDKIAFNDATTGAKGFYRLMWDDGHLYVLVELEGAAKLWDKEKIPTLLSLWYNSDGKVDADGSISLVYPNLIERHDNGLHLGWFKGDNLVKAQAVSGDNVVIELELPWEHKEGKKLEKDVKIGFGAVLKALGKVKADAKGEFIIELTAEEVAKIKPTVLNLLTLFEGSMELDVTGNGNGNGSVTVGGNTNMNAGKKLGTVKVELIGALNGGRIIGSFEDGVDTGTNPGTTTPTGGTSTGGTVVVTGPGSATGGTTGGSGTDTGSGTGNTGGEVLGVSTGAIPSAMPKTGGGGASEQVD
ncbi:hypothetical protein SD71_00645 [Cohnella kolymensis]|uniref:Carbohydrate-binding domain-containing protein n=1 Tax=Cohnella kolymensis TaxID=1590652 RepID=A0ABR5A8B2_9BACL|nr:sugar-binding protein [Cohnella kolymensis]KIL37258.1 hypothetical protein SD71_00645 [Cohnella kolymensis]